MNGETNGQVLVCVIRSEDLQQKRYDHRTCRRQAIALLHAPAEHKMLDNTTKDSAQI